MGRENDAIFSQDEVTSLKKTLKAVLEHDPLKRATIDDIVKVDWFSPFEVRTLQRL